jgi:hypothetical protein
MKDSTSTDTKFLVGNMFGILNDKEFKQYISYKEDYERSLYFSKKDGGVIRFNNVVAKTKIGAKGGLDKDKQERLSLNKKDAQYLIDKYPDMVRLNPRREGEILLKQPKVGGGADEEDSGINAIPIRNRAKYEEAKERLLEVLRETTLPKIGKPEAEKVSAKRVEKGYRRVTNRADVIGSIGRTITFGYGLRKFKGYGEFAPNKRLPELLRCLAEFGNRVVPKGWSYETITLNEGVKAKKHKDSKNVGDSVIIGIGDFTGGDIKVWDVEDKNGKAYNLHDQPLMFNGNTHYHQTTPFKGERYTMIFYKQGKPGKTRGVPMKGKGEEDPEEDEDEVYYGGIFA